MSTLRSGSRTALQPLLLARFSRAASERRRGRRAGRARRRRAAPLPWAASVRRRGAGVGPRGAA